MLDKKSVSEAVGEYATLAELLRRGFTAFLAHGRTQADWDIIVYLPEGDPKKVQVKAIGHQSSAKINTTKVFFDILVIVDTRILEDASAPMRFFVLRPDEVWQVLSPENHDKKESPNIRYISVAPNTENPTLKQALNAWSKINSSTKPTGKTNSR